LSSSMICFLLPSVYDGGGLSLNNS
jgi:hypothetical protein